MNFLNFLKDQPRSVWAMIVGVVIALLTIFGGFGSVLGMADIEVREGFELYALGLAAVVFFTGVAFHLVWLKNQRPPS